LQNTIVYFKILICDKVIDAKLTQIKLTKW